MGGFMKNRLFLLCFMTLITTGSLLCSEILHEVTILHWNDFHSQNIPWRPTHYNPDNHEVGGYAYLAAVIDSLRDIYPNAVTLHAGDDFQGTPISGITRGMSQIAILNVIKPDFFTVGNHEFDYGLSRLLALKDSAEFKMYAANLRQSQEGQRLFKSMWVPENFPFDVAIIGLTTDDLYTLCLPTNLEDLYVENVTETAKHLTDSLTQEGIDFIIAVTHLGIEEDIKLAQNVPAIDLIIGGHSHTYMNKPRIEGNTYIVQASSQGRYLGEIHLQTDGKTIQTFDFNLLEIRPDNISPNTKVLALVEKYETQAGDTLNQVIGELKSDWTREGVESNLGNWLTDAIRTYTGADIGIQNNGGIRKGLSKGPIRIRDIWEITPFGNNIVTFTVTGKEICNMLDVQVKQGISLQFSGVSFIADTAANKAKKVRVNGKRVIPWKKYTLATNNYVGEQIEKYLGLSPRQIHDTGIIDRDLFIKAVKDQKIIDSNIENRITIR